MNEEYLWDKSGEPDVEIQQLEEILGTLKHKSQPFVVPQELLTRSRRNYVPVLAIAASLIIALLAGLIWWRLGIEKTPHQEQVRQVTPSDTPRDQVNSPQVVAINEDQPASKPKVPGKRPNNTRRSVPKLSEEDREEALAAKQQLMIALRLTSEKLNQVQRKTQGTAPASQIRNQHKVG